MKSLEILTKEKYINNIINNIELLNNDEEEDKTLSINLLEDIITYYYLNDFNGSTLEEEPSFLTPLLIEKIHNVNRAISLLIKYNGLTEENTYKVNLIKKAIKSYI